MKTPELTDEQRTRILGDNAATPLETSLQLTLRQRDDAGAR